MLLSLSGTDELVVSSRILGTSSAIGLAKFVPRFFSMTVSSTDIVPFEFSSTSVCSLTLTS